jgi:hypothetical protein
MHNSNNPPAQPDAVRSWDFVDWSPGIILHRVASVEAPKTAVYKSDDPHDVKVFEVPSELLVEEPVGRFMFKKPVKLNFRSMQGWFSGSIDVALKLNEANQILSSVLLSTVSTVFCETWQKWFTSKVGNDPALLNSLLVENVAAKEMSICVSCKNSIELVPPGQLFGELLYRTNFAEFYTLFRVPVAHPDLRTWYLDWDNTLGDCLRVFAEQNWVPKVAMLLGSSKSDRDRIKIELTGKDKGGLCEYLVKFFLDLHLPATFSVCRECEIIFKDRLPREAHEKDLLIVRSGDSFNFGPRQSSIAGGPLHNRSLVLEDSIVAHIEVKAKLKRSHVANANNQTDTGIHEHTGGIQVGGIAGFGAASHFRAMVCFNLDDNATEKEVISIMSTTDYSKLDAIFIIGWGVLLRFRDDEHFSILKDSGAALYVLAYVLSERTGKIAQSSLHRDWLVVPSANKP